VTSNQQSIAAAMTGASGGKGGHYQMGFTLTPLTADGKLDTSGDDKGGNHPVEEDTLYKMSLENREGGNKLIQSGDYESAVARYSELIMQTRALEQETNVEWTDHGRDLVRQLRAVAYLNLSLCFLKTKQWTHAINTATRALQGDKDPADPKEDVLPKDKKAKALFRRAQAHREGSSDLEKARQDLQLALDMTPEDKNLQQELRRVERDLSQAQKAADKKMAGFLSSGKRVESGEGIFTEDLRPDPSSLKAPELKEPMKLSEGLYLVPKDEKEEAAQEAADSGDGPAIDYEDLGREIAEMKEEKPELFKQVQARMQQLVEENVAAAEAESGDEVARETEAAADNKADCPTAAPA